VHFVERKIAIRKKTIHSKTISAGVRHVCSLGAILSGTFLLFLPDRLPHRLNNLPEGANCEGPISGKEKIRWQNTVSILVGISSFLCVHFSKPHTNFQCYFMATNHRNCKHVIRHQSSTQRDCPLCRQLERNVAGMQSCNTKPPPQNILLIA